MSVLINPLLSMILLPVLYLGKLAIRRLHASLSIVLLTDPVTNTSFNASSSIIYLEVNNASTTICLIGISYSPLNTTFSTMLFKGVPFIAGVIGSMPITSGNLNINDLVVTQYAKCPSLCGFRLI